MISSTFSRAITAKRWVGSKENWTASNVGRKICIFVSKPLITSIHSNTWLSGKRSIRSNLKAFNYAHKSHDRKTRELAVICPSPLRFIIYSQPNAFKSQFYAKFLLWNSKFQTDPSSINWRICWIYRHPYCWMKNFYQVWIENFMETVWIRQYNDFIPPLWSLRSA